MLVRHCIRSVRISVRCYFGLVWRIFSCVSWFDASSPDFHLQCQLDKKIVIELIWPVTDKHRNTRVDCFSIFFNVQFILALFRHFPFFVVQCYLLLFFIYYLWLQNNEKELYIIMHFRGFIFHTKNRKSLLSYILYTYT